MSDLDKYLTLAFTSGILARSRVQRVLDAVEGRVYCDVPSVARELSSDIEHIMDALGKMRSGSSAVPQQEAAPDFASLSENQRTAFSKIERWLRRANDPYFVLRGYPGTGKTYLMRFLAGALDRDIVFTAPTNKAAKVLARSVGVAARTTFSALGLRMSENEDELVMEYGREPPEFRAGTVFVVDESSMVNRQLARFIDRVQRDFDLKVLYVGDPMQLPPVGETRSVVWTLAAGRESRASLRTVMRYDNELLALSVEIRRCIREERWRSPVENAHRDREGVFVLSRREFLRDLDTVTIDQYSDRKLVAWRNRTVNEYNARIRDRLGLDGVFAAGERVLLATPVEEDGVVVAHIDDEFVVESVENGRVRADTESIETYRLAVSGDERFVFNVAKDSAELDAVLARKSTEARTASGKARGELWREFWAIRRRFHSLRYGYALTSHRVQGTTLHTVYVDQSDILANTNRPEAFRSLMVAATRPTTRLVTF